VRSRGGAKEEEGGEKPKPRLSVWAGKDDVQGLGRRGRGGKMMMPQGGGAEEMLPGRNESNWQVRPRGKGTRKVVESLESVKGLPERKRSEKAGRRRYGTKWYEKSRHRVTSSWQPGTTRATTGTIGWEGSRRWGLRNNRGLWSRLNQNEPLYVTTAKTK